MKKRFFLLSISILLATLAGSFVGSALAEEVVVSAVTDEWKWKGVDRDPYVGTDEEALALLDFPKEIRPLLMKKIYAHAFTRAKISKGDKIPVMLFGKNKVRKNVRADWRDRERPILAKIYIVEHKGEKYVLVWASVCGNWSRYFVAEKPKKPVVKPPSVKVEKPVPIIVPAKMKVRKEEDPSVDQFLELSYDGEPAPDLIIEEPASDKMGGAKLTDWLLGAVGSSSGCWEHNPDLGIWYGRNEISHFGGVWFDHISWCKNRGTVDFQGKSYSYDLGIGAVGSYSPGEVLDTDYSWEEWLLGVQVGAQSTYADAETGYLRQLQAKLKLAYEWQEGSSGSYWMEQENIKIGLHGEYVHQYEDEWTSITTLDSWYDISNPHFESSWSGDSPQDRFEIGAGQYFQHQINRDWAIKFGGGLKYQGWDELYGITALAELRWQNTIMFGPSLFVPFTTGIYDAYSISDLTTWYGFIRAELGWRIRKNHQVKNADRVFQIPRGS